MVTLNPRLKELLIEAGVNGVSKKTIRQAFMNSIMAPEINATLDEWHSLGYVQFFRDENTGGRPATIIRATEKILEMEDESA